MEHAATMTIGLHVTDVSGQKHVRASTPPHATIGELVRSLIAKMGLRSSTSRGEPLAYQARLECEGRHLHGSETVGDALRADDEIVLTPNIDAGRGTHGAHAG